MGLALLFIPASLLIDLYRSFIFLLRKRSKKGLIAHIASSKLFLFVPFVISILLTAYGYIEAKNLHTERVLIKTSKIPKEIGKVKILQISDVHLGLMIREDRLRKVINEIRVADPDLLVSTGDLVDGKMKNLTNLAELLKETNPRYGKFAVTGNHEFHAGLDQSLDFIKRSGFTILRGEALTVAGIINIAGVDDPTGMRYGLYREVRERDLLTNLPHEKFTVLLKHKPFVEKDVIGFFDLQLSGHVHKGQIFPYSLLTMIYYYPAYAGCLNLVDDSYLYVSRGAGTWGPPIRFLAPPEVTLIELVHKD
jgi:predicted MPP superfamily phosphohydrolase